MVKSKQKAFTLVELLVVISIIALLLSITMPTLSRVKHDAKRVVCGTRIKQIGVSLYTYTNNYNSKFPTKLDSGNWPMGVVIESWTKKTTAQGRGSVSVHFPAGLALLWMEDYIEDMSFFYCPAASRVGLDNAVLANNSKGAVYNYEQFLSGPATSMYRKTGNKMYIEWGNVFMGYSYWIGRDASYPTLEGVVPKNALDSSWKVAVTDNCITKGLASKDSSRNWAENFNPGSSHIYGNKLQGTNVLRSDGSVEWQKMSKLENCRNSSETNLPENIRFANDSVSADVNFWFGHP